MLLPVRCFSCHKVIGHTWALYQKLLASGLTPNQAFIKINIRRYCCKRMLLSHIPIIDKVLLYT